MSEQKPRVAIVGEVLIELARETDGRFRLGYVGDTFNVAVYLARGGIETAFVTALGEDPYSDAVVALATAEGIAGDLMLRIRGRLPRFIPMSGSAVSLRPSKRSEPRA
jgi:2-dehydro-3-deoxygluconokinase